MIVITLHCITTYGFHPSSSFRICFFRLLFNTFTSFWNTGCDSLFKVRSQQPTNLLCSNVLKSPKYSLSKTDREGIFRHQTSCTSSAHGSLPPTSNDLPPSLLVLACFIPTTLNYFPLYRGYRLCAWVRWCFANGLVLNVRKCHSMRFLLLLP